MSGSVLRQQWRGKARALHYPRCDTTRSATRRASFGPGVGVFLLSNVVVTSGRLSQRCQRWFLQRSCRKCCAKQADVNHKLWKAQPLFPLWFWRAYWFHKESRVGQASAETHKLWAAELAAKAQRRVERISKKTEWASRLEAAALAEPVVRHPGTLPFT